MSKDLNGQKAVKTVFAIVDEQHILLSDTICGHNGLEGQFESSAMELEKVLCDSFGIEKRNICVEQVEHFYEVGFCDEIDQAVCLVSFLIKNKACFFPDKAIIMRV